MAELKARVRELEAEAAETERQNEALTEALCNQEFHVLDGYVVTVWPVGDGSYVASCPTLHVSVQEASKEEALHAVTQAAAAARNGRAHFGRPMPPRDLDQPCLDWPQ